MAAVKLFRRAIGSSSLTFKSLRQSTVICSNSIRHLTSASSNQYIGINLTNMRLCTTVLTRGMSTNSKFEVINIQDEDDFNEKVLCSSEPIVVDFHAE